MRAADGCVSRGCPQVRPFRPAPAGSPGRLAHGWASPPVAAARLGLVRGRGAPPPAHRGPQPGPPGQLRGRPAAPRAGAPPPPGGLRPPCARSAAAAVVSHASAAVLHGFPLWNVPLQRVHATRARPSGGRQERCSSTCTPRHCYADEIWSLTASQSPASPRTLVRSRPCLSRSTSRRRAGCGAGPGSWSTGRHSRRRCCAPTGWRGCPAARRAVAFAEPGAAERRRVAQPGGDPAGGLPPPVAPVGGPRRVGPADRAHRLRLA